MVLMADPRDLRVLQIYRRDSEFRFRRNSPNQFVMTTIFVSASVRVSVAKRFPSGETESGDRELAPAETGNGTWKTARRAITSTFEPN